MGVPRILNKNLNPPNFTKRNERVSGLKEEEWVRKLEAIIQLLESALRGLRRLQVEISAEAVRREKR